MPLPGQEPQVQRLAELLAHFVAQPVESLLVLEPLAVQPGRSSLALEPLVAQSGRSSLVQEPLAVQPVVVLLESQGMLLLERELWQQVVVRPDFVVQQWYQQVQPKC